MAHTAQRLVLVLVLVLAGCGRTGLAGLTPWGGSAGGPPPAPSTPSVPPAMMMPSTGPQAPPMMIAPPSRPQQPSMMMPPGPRCPASNGIECDDGFGCTIDRCVDGVCMNAAAPDGAACDDGDVCTEDGKCVEGRCEPSTAPRQPRVLQSLPTYGEGATDAATDGKIFVFAGKDRYEIVALTAERGFVYRSAVPMPGARFVEPFDHGRFLVRDDAGAVALLDARDPLVPGLTRLPHITPQSPPTPSGFTSRGTRFGDNWAVLDTLAVIGTHTQYDEDPNAIAYRLTAVPLDPKLGGPRYVDVQAYRLAAIEGGLAWTMPGGTAEVSGAVGVLRFNATGDLVASSRLPLSEAEALGCGQPRYIGGFRNSFATLSDEADDGYARLCLWQVGGDSDTSFTLLHSRGLDEHVHACGIELDERYLYISCHDRNEYGALGARITEGETVRYALDTFMGSDSGLTFADGELLMHTSGAVKTEIEGGILWTVDDMAVAIDLEWGLAPISGPGYGRFTNALADDDLPRAMAGGLASFGVIEGVRAGPTTPIGVEGGRHEIRFGDHWFEYPRTGHTGGDIRVLQHDERLANLNPFLRYHPEPTTERLMGMLDDQGFISLERRDYAVETLEARQIGVTQRHIFVFDGAIEGWAQDDGEMPSLSVATTVSAKGILRGDASGTQLVFGGPRSYALYGLETQVVNPQSYELPTEVFAIEPHMRRVEHGYGFAVDGDQALVASVTGVELHHLGGTNPTVTIEFPDVDPQFAVSLPLVAEGRALATYVATDGKARLVQLLYGQGTMHEVATLATSERVLGAAPFDGRWLLVNDAGVDLADLACWRE